MSSTMTSLSHDTFKKIHPQEYYKRFLQHNLRPDGRSPKDIRKVSLSTDVITTADGSSTVRLGETCIICGIKAEVSEPKFEEPSKGYIVPNIDISPMCSSSIKPGPPSEIAQFISQTIFQIFTDGDNIIDPEDLCILKGKAVWVLYIDLICVNHDGNILDAAILAVMAALKSTRLPDVSVEDDIVSIKSNSTSPLTLKELVVSSSVGFIEEFLMSDLNAEEERLCSTRMTAMFNSNGSLCKVIHLGQRSMNKIEVSECLKQSMQQAECFRKCLEFSDK